MIKIPFSKSEIFVNKILTFKEKRQLVKTIEMCLLGADQIEQGKKLINSTHEYQKDITLTEQE
jgi:RAB protein geranylgeranyltransferase component A